LREEETIKFTDLDTPEAYEKFLTTLLYKDLRWIGKGGILYHMMSATTVTFKAKNIQGLQVAVKVQ
jgi:hypothetical protein